jgi:DNA-directed RNA polymerase subunit H (RpoH/RPB5)
MKKQNYNVEDYENFSVNDVNSMFQNKQLDMLLEKNEPDSDDKKILKIYIKYYLEKTLRPQNVQEIIDDLFNLEEVLNKDDTLMIIVKDETNDTLLNLVKHIWEQDGILIVIQNIKRLQYNILEHTLVPNHRILSRTEYSNIKEKFNIMEDGQFPEISRFDPVAQVIGIRPGQVCEIIRPSKSAVQSTYYRICV